MSHGYMRNTMRVLPGAEALGRRSARVSRRRARRPTQRVRPIHSPRHQAREATTRAIGVSLELNKWGF